MKNNYLTYAVLSLALMLGVTACSDDDALVKPEPSPIVVPELPEFPELNVESESFDLKKETSKSLQITSGAGEYRVNVLDPGIASATVEGNLLTVTGLVVGKTEVVVSDKGGSYESLKINVYNSDVVTLDTEHIDLTLKMGAPATTTFRITDGNPAYRVSSSAPEIATAEIGEDGATVTVTGLNGGEATITVTDSRNLTAAVTVSNTVTTSPFTDEELEEFKSLPLHTYLVNGQKIKGQLDMGGYDDIMWGYYVYGAYSVNMTTDYLYLTSKTKPEYDMNTLGKKPGLKLAYRKDKQILVDEVEAEVEVIKVDGSTVWMTFYVQTDILYSGCLVVGLTD